MTDKNTDQTATVRQKAPEIASINGQLLEEIKYYKAHADKLAEALWHLTKEIKLGTLNVRKDFSLMNAHACATKALHQYDNERQ